MAIRDGAVYTDRPEPAPGALFVANMLVNTDDGRTFTLKEITEDFEPAGFTNVELIHPTQDMNRMVMAEKP